MNVLYLYYMAQPKPRQIHRNARNHEILKSVTACIQSGYDIRMHDTSCDLSQSNISTVLVCALFFFLRIPRIIHMVTRTIKFWNVSEYTDLHLYVVIIFCFGVCIATGISVMQAENNNRIKMVWTHQTIYNFFSQIWIFLQNIWYQYWFSASSLIWNICDATLGYDLRKQTRMRKKYWMFIFVGISFITNANWIKYRRSRPTWWKQRIALDVIIRMCTDAHCKVFCWNWHALTKRIGTTRMRFTKHLWQHIRAFLVLYQLFEW